jgi:hypothetical protein
MHDYPYLGKLFCLRLMLIKMVICCDPDAIREVLIGQNYPKSPTYSGRQTSYGISLLVDVRLERLRKCCIR